LEKTQILKGILEGCILLIISKENTYGYGILEILKHNGFSDITEGTIYPILIRLEKQGMLSSQLKESPLGPRRKYYSLTQKGESELSEFLQEWELLSKNVDGLIRGENADA
jgi:PadR family transcriptional regulator PadR